MVQEWELFTYCAEKLFIVRLSLKKKKDLKKVKETPRIFFTLPPFFKKKNSLFCLCTHRRKFPIRSFPVSKVFSLWFFFVFSLYLSTLNWTGIMLMSVEYYNTPKRIIPCFTKRHGRRWEIPDGRERELANGLKSDMKTPQKHESQKKRKNKQTKK